MPESVHSNSSLEEGDPNQNRSINKHEFRELVSNIEGTSSTTYETSASRLHDHEISAAQLGRNNYQTLSSEIYLDGSISGRRLQQNAYSTRESVAVVNGFTNETVIETHSVEETNRFLERTANICRDPDPIVIRKTVADRPVTYQQRVLVRYLQPPPAPAPGPLIIKEVREPQAAPLPPLVIRQYAEPAVTPPPLVLRERPPLPPSPIPSETVIRRIPGLPPPPRSIIVERFPAPPEKPRDIIIERWLPYGPAPERRTIVEEAQGASSVSCSECRNQIVIYERVEPRVVRRLEKEDVVRENPADYVARYGNTLLDSTTLVETARNAGIHEDLSLPALSYSSVRASTIDYGVSVKRLCCLLIKILDVPGMIIHRKFVRPTNFSFPSSTLWSRRVAKYREQVVDGRTTSVTLELLEDGATIYTRTITKQEYRRKDVTSSAPKLAWDDFLLVLQVFMLGNSQERESDIARAFDILDQGRRGLYNRTITLSDGQISPDELRAFLSILTDEYRVDLCVFLADTDGSGQISLSEFTRLIKSGLARDIICESV
ncbi:unnamed protein product [Adineta ricciae]|uniref:EF-hand domain-containing protein n=1 Tax=Adineta ricciae TaxID=249248 RepID=A0A815PYB2_ADIRI|nr:unnamed protein product [Adineta ricciae]